MVVHDASLRATQAQDPGGLTMNRSGKRLLLLSMALLASLALVATACGDSDDSSDGDEDGTEESSTPTTINVPEDHATIQKRSTPCRWAT